MGKGAPAYTRGLQGHRLFSERRAVRFNEPDPPGLRVYPGQYCRRVWTERQGRVGTLLQVSMGSASELDYHLLLAHDLGLLRDKEYEQLQTQAVEVKRMLSSLIVSLRRR